MNNVEKSSYKNIVVEGKIIDTQVSKEKDIITGYDEIINKINMKIQKSNNKYKTLSNSKKELLTDLLNDMANITDYVKEYYGFHGIGDELLLENVMNCFEKSLQVEVVSDNDYDIVSEEDEI